MFRFLVTKVAWFSYAPLLWSPILPFNLVRAMAQPSVWLAEEWLWSLAVVPGYMVSWFLRNPGYISVLGMSTLGDKSLGLLLSSWEMPRAFLPSCPNLSLSCWCPNLRLLLTHHLIFWLRSPPWFLLWRSPPSGVGIGPSSQFCCLCSLLFTMTPDWGEHFPVPVFFRWQPRG